MKREEKGREGNGRGGERREGKIREGKEGRVEMVKMGEGREKVERERRGGKGKKGRERRKGERCRAQICMATTGPMLTTSNATLYPMISSRWNFPSLRADSQVL